MGAVGGLLGLNGGNSGTGYSTPSGTNQTQLNTAYNQNQNLLTALQGQNGIGNQNQVYGQLQGVVNGQGPNPAQAMLNQATSTNVANQAALAAGQRGAGSNVGLLSRQAAQTGANAQQQAAGQAATMQANQSLGALGQAGQMANTQAGQQIGATQNEQNILQNANTANNQVQGQLANTSMQGQQGLLGGVMNGIGGALGSILAEGGVVGYDGGGQVAGPQSNFAKYLTASGSGSGGFQMADTKGAKALQSGAQNMFGALAKKPADPMAGAQNITPTGYAGTDPTTQVPTQMAAAEGGSVKAVVSPQEIILTPAEAKMVADGRVKASQVGYKVPGKAKVKGDSYSNDTVPMNLPEGGVVVKRTKAKSDEDSRGFVRAVMARKKVKK